MQEMGEPAPRPYSEPPEPDVRRFGRYTLCYRVARGGMASVYLAQLRAQTGFTKWVALKMIHPRMASDERFVQMFLHEAQILSRLDHPNVCSVFDFGQQGDEYYLAMEYLHGESLASVIRRGKVGGKPPTYAVAARIVSDAARGLHAAHELTTSEGRPAGVVHRDVSPQNIFCLYEGISKVVDFGIARSDEREEITQTGELKGKFHYMAPEQLKQEEVDRRTDVFALGIVLWELTVGKRLFKRKKDVETMMAVLAVEVPFPSDKRSDYPEALEKIVMRALAPSPEGRFQTCDELARALNGFIAKSGESADHPEVADYLSGLFAERRRAREEMLQKAPTLAVVPVLELESESESLRIEQQLDPQKPRIVGVEQPRTIPAPPLRSTPWRAIALGGGALALVTLGYFFMREPSSASMAPPPTGTAPTSAAADRLPADPPPVEPAPVAPVVTTQETPPEPVANEIAPSVTEEIDAPPTLGRNPRTTRIRTPRGSSDAPAQPAVEPRPVRPRGGPQLMTDFERVD